ncbi:KipI family sensor histidine kinase inhibitor [Rhodoligotrophos appendicifer]|uniref:5-oxoprolinase subunit PxpB n=1 Tax=Rhodoligotrophos appendicifer TaxID=987056 RepID=UPI001186FF89|nr:5-oxoprolinase subunit PxpB [Rhodoligotrophos appendicifer]
MSDAAYHQPRFLDAGDTGLVVELGNEICEITNGDVISLAEALAALDLPSIRDIIPTYRSLLVSFDPLVLDRQRLKASVLDLWPPAAGVVRRATRWRIPVCYGGAHGVDLKAVAEQHRISVERLIEVHSQAEYRVYMLGFSPGFAYLGGLPDAIHTSRRHEPRQVTPPSSISIGGKQAAVAPPMEAPSGWQLLGQTPVRSYDPRRTDRPFLFEPGDLVHFVPISEAEYDAMSAAAEAGREIALSEPADA